MNILDLNNIPINYVKKLNVISYEIKTDYHELVEKIYNSSDGSIHWLVNSLLSRNNYLSKVFINLCYLELVKEILKEEKISRIIVLNIEQKRVLKKYLKNKQYNIDLYHRETFLNKNKKVIKPVKSFATNILYCFQHFFHKNKNRRLKICKIDNVTLIDTFLIPSMINKNKFDDRYYKNLLDNLPKGYKKKIYFMPTLLFRKKIGNSIKICEEAEENFLFKLDFLKIEDYVKALFSPFLINRINFNSFTFRGVNIEAFLKSDFIDNVSNTGSFIGILNYYFFKRLKEYNIKLRFVINWFENQVIDRGFNYGKNIFFPEVSSTGYQSFMVPYSYNFHLKPTLTEFKMNVLPDKIATVSKGMIPDIKEYCKKLEVVEAPALRFDYIYNKSINIPDNKKKKILIALPMSLEDSSDIMKLIIEVYDEKYVQKLDFIIKPHPALDLSQLEKKFSKWPKKIEYFKEDFFDILKKTDLLIGNNSSTCMESLACAVPVIIIGSQRGLTQNPIPNTISKEIWELCYTCDELMSSIKRLIDSNINRKTIINLSKQIREDYFEPVNKENVSKFLNFN